MRQSYYVASQVYSGTSGSLSLNYKNEVFDGEQEKGSIICARME